MRKNVDMLKGKTILLLVYILSTFDLNDQYQACVKV